jgi:hypothetical protein
MRRMQLNRTDVKLNKKITPNNHDNNRVIEKNALLTQMHIHDDCPGWEIYGWTCINCKRYNDSDSKSFGPAFCPRCSHTIDTWECGCLKKKDIIVTKTTNNLGRYIIGKRISVYWPEYDTWYSGTVVALSGPQDEGTHDIDYDDEPGQLPISEKLVSNPRETWKLLSS